MGATDDITIHSDKGKQKKGLASVEDPIAIQRKKEKQYMQESRHSDWYCGVVDGVNELRTDERGSFLNPMRVTGKAVATKYILDNTDKFHNGLIVYWTTVALTKAQQNLRKKLMEAREKKRKWVSEQKTKAFLKFMKKSRHTCKGCNSVFDVKRGCAQEAGVYCPVRGCGECLTKLPKMPKSIQERIDKLTDTYVLKTTAREQKRKREYDENSNPKKKPFKEAESGVTYGGLAAC